MVLKVQGYGSSISENLREYGGEQMAMVGVNAGRSSHILSQEAVRAGCIQTQIFIKTLKNYQGV
jgi:hypothetical protein